MTMSLKILKILLMNSIIFFVTVASRIKEPIETSDFDKLQQFCNEINSYRIVYWWNAETTITHRYLFFSTRDLLWKSWKISQKYYLTKATGSDNIGPRLLKLTAPFISDSLTYICYQSIITSTFPDKWKEGKVRPLHKADTNNYRPISVLPVLSKLLEKHVHDSLMSFLILHNVLHSTQPSFRPNHSCETALLQMINKFHEAINNGQITGIVMVDFRKAFDLVDHTLLLKKLRHYKISNETLFWFSSYLLNRKQIVLNNIESTTENIVCGVPQCSILGPLLFLIFINDLPHYTDNINTDLYADDTTIFQISKSQHFIEHIRNTLQLPQNLT